MLTTRSCLADGVRGAGVASCGARSTFDLPGDRTADAATTPSGSFLNSICSVFGVLRVKGLVRRLAKPKISRRDDERRGEIDR